MAKNCFFVIVAFTVAKFAEEIRYSRWGIGKNRDYHHCVFPQIK